MFKLFFKDKHFRDAVLELRSHGISFFNTQMKTVAVLFFVLILVLASAVAFTIIYVFYSEPSAGFIVATIATFMGASVTAALVWVFMNMVKSAFNHELLMGRRWKNDADELTASNNPEMFPSALLENYLQRILKDNNIALEKNIPNSVEFYAPIGNESFRVAYMDKRYTSTLVVEPLVASVKKTSTFNHEVLLKAEKATINYSVKKFAKLSAKSKRFDAIPATTTECRSLILSNNFKNIEEALRNNFDIPTYLLLTITDTKVEKWSEMKDWPLDWVEEFVGTKLSEITYV